MPRYLLRLQASVAHAGGTFVVRRLERLGDVLDLSPTSSSTRPGWRPVRWSGTTRCIRCADRSSGSRTPASTCRCATSTTRVAAPTCTRARTDCILGGTLDAGVWDTEPDPAETEAILARCADIVPALAGAEALESLVGLRSGAPGDPGRARRHPAAGPGRPRLRARRLGDHRRLGRAPRTCSTWSQRATEERVSRRESPRRPQAPVDSGAAGVLVGASDDGVGSGFWLVCSSGFCSGAGSSLVGALGFAGPLGAGAAGVLRRRRGSRCVRRSGGPSSACPTPRRPAAWPRPRHRPRSPRTARRHCPRRAAGRRTGSGTTWSRRASPRPRGRRPRRRRRPGSSASLVAVRRCSRPRRRCAAPGPGWRGRCAHRSGRGATR